METKSSHTGYLKPEASPGNNVRGKKEIHTMHMLTDPSKQAFAILFALVETLAGLVEEILSAADAPARSSWPC